MKPSFFHPRNRSFSLLELLVAVAVLALILTLMFNMVGMTFHATSTGQGRIDNFTRARATLDVIAGDIQRGIFRPDLPAFGTQNGLQTNNGITFLTNGAPAVAFYTQNPGPISNARNLSLVVYKLDGSTNAVLRRDQLSIPWSVPGADWSSTLPFQGELATGINNATSRDMAEGVVGFQLFFCRSDQSISTTYSGYKTDNPVIAVGVALVVVDPRSLKLLNSAGKLNTLTHELSSASTLTGTNSAKADWDRRLESNGFYQDYPVNLSSGLKTFERLIRCDPPF